MPVIRLPGLEVDRVEIAKAGFHESQSRMTARIKNPGLLKLKLKDAGFEFDIDHILRLKGTPEEDIELAPKTTQSIPVVFDVGTAKVLRLSWKVLLHKNIPSSNCVFMARSFRRMRGSMAPL